MPTHDTTVAANADREIEICATSGAWFALVDAERSRLGRDLTLDELAVLSTDAAAS